MPTSANGHLRNYDRRYLPIFARTQLRLLIQLQRTLEITSSKGSRLKLQVIHGQSYAGPRLQTLQEGDLLPLRYLKQLAKNKRDA